MKTIALIVVVLLGCSVFVYGGADDSPGAQLLGALVALAGAAGLVRVLRKKKSGT